MNKKQLKRNQERQARWDYIGALKSIARTHPNYDDYFITVDSLMDRGYYDSGDIISICPQRIGFDNLHELYSDLYRGGFKEIKVGDDYIIYGFEFD